MKSFKAFIKSWYYFLKEEKWVARTFMVIVVLIVLFINNITESLFYYDHDVLEYGAIKKYSLSFDIIAQKLYNRLEEEISADPNVTGLRAFLDGDEISYWCMYDDGTNGETIILPLNMIEKQSAKNIQENTFTLEGRYPGSISVWKSQVVFSVMARYEIKWFPDRNSFKQKKAFLAERNNYELKRVHPLFTNLYILYEKKS